MDPDIWPVTQECEKGLCALKECVFGLPVATQQKKKSLFSSDDKV